MIESLRACVALTVGVRGALRMHLPALVCLQVLHFLCLSHFNSLPLCVCVCAELESSGFCLSGVGVGGGGVMYFLCCCIASFISLMKVLVTCSL